MTSRPSPADVVREQFTAFASGLDAVTRYWHPDIEWRAVEGAADDVGVMRGHEPRRRYYGTQAAAAPAASPPRAATTWSAESATA